MVQHFVRVPWPYRMEHAAFFVQHRAIAGWDSGQRAEFLAHVVEKVHRREFEP